MDNIDDYAIGIIYATGTFVMENQKAFLVVRNTDSWYASYISKYSKCSIYKSGYHMRNKNTDQWIIKARDINGVPPLSAIKEPSDFCRAYIEIHGVVDKIRRRRTRKQGLRLRIYGKEWILDYINHILPAKEKTIQHITCKNQDGTYGSTCALHYQSINEVTEIIQWLDGNPKNLSVWKKWKKALNE